MNLFLSSCYSSESSSNDEYSSSYSTRENSSPTGSYDLCFKKNNFPRSESKRVKFTKQEDAILLEQVNKLGAKKWNTIAQALPGRTSRQCRDRFMNYLNNSLVNGPWTEDEDILLEQKYEEYGPQWSFITTFFKGRSSNNIKNRWYTHVSKRRNVKATVPETPIIEPIHRNRSELTPLPSLFSSYDYSNCIDLFFSRIEKLIDQSNKCPLLTL